MTSDQIADVVALFLEENPDMRNYGGAGFVGMAVSEVWPCPGDAPSQGNVFDQFDQPAE